MPINKLTAGSKGNPFNSKGKDVAESVNALIDQGEDLELRLSEAEQQIAELPAEIDAAGTAAMLVDNHNSSPTAHPELTAFITSEADRAEFAANSAEVSEDIALSAGFIYETVLDGEAARVDGEYFWVVSAADTNVLDLYLMGASTATATGKSTPSSNYVYNTNELARKANYVFFGKATKVQRISGTNNYQLSWGRLYFMTRSGISLQKVQAVTDIQVNDGFCAYIDLAEPKVNDEYVVHVSSVSVTAGSNPPTLYIDDSKLVLFVCFSNILGGYLQPQGVADGTVTIASIDTTLSNRTSRPAYNLIGDLTNYRMSGSSAVISFADLRLARGTSAGTLTIAGQTDLVIPIGKAAYADLSAPLVDGKIVPQITTNGYATSSTAEPAGSFLNDNKVYLFINAAEGQSGPLAARKPLKLHLGEVWLKNNPCNITFDVTTRTLAWDNTLILPSQGGQNRVRLAAGSHQFSDEIFNVAYLDMPDAVTTGDTPATAVKSGVYFNSADADRFVGDNNQIPIFYWNGASDFGSLGGFPVASIVGGAAASSYEDNDIVVNVAENLVKIYVKGSKSNSLKYFEFNLGYENRPFDPTGTDIYGNSDLWRLKHAYECDLNVTNMTFTRTRSGLPVLNGGEIECAIRENGKPDFVGGFHGDEIKTLAVIFLDGVLIPFDSFGTYVGKRLEFRQSSTIFSCNTETPIAEHVKSFEIKNNSGAELSLSQSLTWFTSSVLNVAYMTMLPIKRLINDTSGDLITGSAVRYPWESIEDISTTGFTQIPTIGSLPDVNIWGPTGVSASVKVLRKPDIANSGFYIANAVQYNKLYYSVAGTNQTGLGAGPNYTTSVGESWDFDTEIRISLTS